MAFELYTQPFIKSIEIKSRILIQINAGMEEDSLPLSVQNIRYIFLKGLIINPLTPKCDQGIISPYIINTISSSQVMRTKNNIN